MALKKLDTNLKAVKNTVEKLQKDLKATEIQWQTDAQRANKYKKRLQRFQIQKSPSPSKKIILLAGGRKVPTPVKKRLQYLGTLAGTCELYRLHHRAAA